MARPRDPNTRMVVDKCKGCGKETEVYAARNTDGKRVHGHSGFCRPCTSANTQIYQERINRNSRKHAVNNGKPWTQSDVQKVAKLYLEGIPVPSIAYRMGRTVYSIRDQIRRTQAYKTKNGHTDISEHPMLANDGQDKVI